MIQKRKSGIQKLASDKTLSQSKLDDARLLANTSLIELRKQEFYRAAWGALLVAVRLGPKAVSDWLGKKSLEKSVLIRQLEQARARLRRAKHELKLAEIRSPIDGIVLNRYEQGDKTVPAGQDLLLLGNLDQLEVIADVLTQDALRLSPGSEASLSPASGREPLAGKLKRIEPAGFTKLSSLGVEQQRVNVIVSFVGKPTGLGVGYRLEARFFSHSKADALVVPRFSVLQASDQTLYVMKIEGGKLKRQTVRVGLRSDLKLEIVDGLSEQDTIVAAPDATMKDGGKVAVKSGG